MTFAEMREAQRIAEVSMIGPGSGPEIPVFGSDIKTKINFGSKYKFKPDQNPAPGQYDTDSA